MKSGWIITILIVVFCIVLLAAYVSSFTPQVIKKLNPHLPHASPTPVISPAHNALY